MLDLNQKHVFDFDCPSCNNKFKTSILLKSSVNETNCPKCNQSISFNTDKLKNDLNSVENKIRKLLKSKSKFKFKF